MFVFCVKGTRDEVNTHQKTDNHQIIILELLNELRTKVANQEKVIEDIQTNVYFSRGSQLTISPSADNLSYLKPEVNMIL